MSQVTTTNCNVRNITPSTLVYQISNDWQGHVGDHYPTQILSEATATFQHVGNQNGSEGAVVYRIPATAENSYDVLVAWLNPPNSTNKAYTLVDQAGSFTPDRWPAIFDALVNSDSKSSSTLAGFTSTVEIGEGNFPTLSAAISTA